MRRVTTRFTERAQYNSPFKEGGGRSLCHSLNLELGEIDENLSFDYHIILPKGIEHKKFRRAILFFHGLNEKSWDKYLPWAELLTRESGLPIILFPLSLHINRAPTEWSDARAMQRLVERERSPNLTFVNYAMSKRIEASPLRFYLSGRESILNICQLVEEIKEGKNPLFVKECRFNIFSYSIGALLSQVLLMANPHNYFSSSRLFMFCGGSLFCEMNGNSRYIMDQHSFERLRSYYTAQFREQLLERGEVDEIDLAFLAHIDGQYRAKERDNFYKSAQERVRAISLKRDKVIPTNGIKRALSSIWKSCLTELELPFNYCHENPFPLLNRMGGEEQSWWFKTLFSDVALFLK